MTGYSSLTSRAAARRTGYLRGRLSAEPRSGCVHADGSAAKWSRDSVVQKQRL